MKKVNKITAKGGLKGTIEEALSLSGSTKGVIKKGDVVLLKPNYNSADPFPASTDPEFLRAVTDLIYDYGAKTVIIGESSTYFLNTRKILSEAKVFNLLDLERPPKIYVFDEREWIKKTIKGKNFKNIHIPKVVEEVDKLIYLPCLKTHFKSQFTGSLKLSVGLIKPFERVKLHMGNIQEKIAEINTAVEPDLIIMDARKCFITGGPFKGEARKPGLIMASTSRVAIDIEGIKTIQKYKGNELKGIKPSDLTQIRSAIELKIS